MLTVIDEADDTIIVRAKSRKGMELILRDSLPWRLVTPNGWSREDAWQDYKKIDFQIWIDAVDNIGGNDGHS